jgi:hypothetical protein
MGAHLGAARLRLVVLGRPHQLGRAGDDAVEPPDEQQAVGNQHHPAPVGFHHRTVRRLQPAEPAAGLDAFLGGLAQILQIVAAKLPQPLDRGHAHGLPVDRFGRSDGVCNRIVGPPPAVALLKKKHHEGHEEKD